MLRLKLLEDELLDCLKINCSRQVTKLLEVAGTEKINVTMKSTVEQIYKIK